MTLQLEDSSTSARRLLGRLVSLREEDIAAILGELSQPERQRLEPMLVEAARALGPVGNRPFGATPDTATDTGGNALNTFVDTGRSDDERLGAYAASISALPDWLALRCAAHQPAAQRNALLAQMRRRRGAQPHRHDGFRITAHAAATLLDIAVGTPAMPVGKPMSAPTGGRIKTLLVTFFSLLP